LWPCSHPGGVLWFFPLSSSAASAGERAIKAAMKIETIVKAKNFAVVLFIINLRSGVSIVLAKE
jgi:hypothetical protein